MSDKSIRKTNAMRALDAKRIRYEAFTYPAEIHSAADVAAFLGLPPQKVYKTLVVIPDRGRPLLVMLAGEREMDPRLVAKAVGVKRVEMAPKREAERLTGLQVGGIGALALLGKPFDVYLDRPALDEEWILVNGGQRGLNLRLSVADLVAVTGARVVEASAGGAASGEVVEPVD